MRKILNKSILLLLVAVFILPITLLSGCGREQINLFTNPLFTDRIYEVEGDTTSKLKGVRGWDVYSPMPELLTLNVEPTDLAESSSAASAFKVSISTPTEGKRSYFYVSQTVKVRKNTVYCFSYKVKLSITTDSTQPFVYGVYPTILQDKVTELPELHTNTEFASSLNYTINRVTTTRSTYQSCSFYFSSNDLTEVTLAVWMGSPNSGNSGTLTLNSMSLTPQLSTSVDPSTVYVADKTNGYVDSVASGIVLIVLCTVLFVALFVAGVFAISYSLAKKKKKQVKLDFEVPDNIEMAVSDSVSSEEGEVEIKFDKDMLSSLYDNEIEGTTQQLEAISLPNEHPLVDTAEAGKEAETIEVKTAPAPNKFTTAVEHVQENVTLGFRRYLNKPWLLLCVILAVAFVARVVLALCVRGYRPELDTLYSYFTTLSKYGVSSFYTYANSGEGSFMGVGTLYVLEISRLLTSLFNASYFSPLGMLFLKLPWIIADVISALLLYFIAKRYVGRNFALSISALYALNPAVMLSSVAWAQPDSLYTLFLLLAFYAILERQVLSSMIFYTLAVAFSANAVYVMPIFFTYYIYKLVVSVKYVVKERTLSALKKKNGQFAWRFFAYIASCLVFLYLFSLPAMLSELSEMFFLPIQNIYFALTQFSLFSQNSFNFFTMLGRNGAELESFPSLILAVVFAVLVAAIVVVVFVSKRNRANLVLLGSYAIYTLTFFSVDVKPSYMLPCLALLILSLVVIKDSRILLIYAATSLLNILNQTLVLHYARYVNNSSDHILTSANPLYMGEVFSENGFVVYIVFSALAFILFAYFTYVLLELGLAGRRRKLLPMSENTTPLAILKSLFR